MSTSAVAVEDHEHRNERRGHTDQYTPGYKHCVWKETKKKKKIGELRIFSILWSVDYLAKLLAKAESDTDGPHMGNIPLQRVLAF